jgi:hypothetical protein
MMTRAVLVLLLSLFAGFSWADDPQAPTPEVSSPDLDNSAVGDRQRSVNDEDVDMDEKEDPEFDEPTIE